MLELEEKAFFARYDVVPLLMPGVGRAGTEMLRARSDVGGEHVFVVEASLEELEWLLLLGGWEVLAGTDAGRKYGPGMVAVSATHH